MSKRDEYDWYSREIITARKALYEADRLFAELRDRVDRLERDRAALFAQLLKEADERADLSSPHRGAP